MKLKNLFLGIFVSVLCVGFITSCSSDDDDYAPGIVGNYVGVIPGTDDINISIEAIGTNKVKLTTANSFSYINFLIPIIECEVTTSKGVLTATNLSGEATVSIDGLGPVTVNISGGIEPLTGMGTINVSVTGQIIPLAVTRVIEN